MSIQSEIDRIENNIAATYAELEEQGADMPSVLNSDNLAAAAATTKTVKYIAQSLTAAQKKQARENIGIYTANVKDYGAKGNNSTDDTAAFQNALAANRVVYVPGGSYKLSGGLTIGNNCQLELAQDAVLYFTQTSGNCISMKMGANIKGNHATVIVPYTFSGNVVYVYTQLNQNVKEIPPFTNWDPQWKTARYITDLSIAKPNSNGTSTSTDGTCYGTAVYISAETDGNSSTPDSSFIWGLHFSGLRIAGGFKYGVRAYNVGDGTIAYNHDMRIEALIDACEIGVSLENCRNAYLSTSVQPRKADNGTVYAKHGIYLSNSANTDMSSARIWDWNSTNSLYAEGNQYQHFAMMGNCQKTLLSDLAYGTLVDIRDRIYTDNQSNLDTLIVLQEPFTKYFKPIDNEPYFYTGSLNKRLTFKEELDEHFETSRIAGFTDVLATAEGEDGNIFNGKGYRKDGYWSGSDYKTFSASSYYHCTGYIPCKKGDEIYFEDMSFATGDGMCGVRLFDENHNFLIYTDGTYGEINQPALIKGNNYYVGYAETEKGFKLTINNIPKTPNPAYLKLTLSHSSGIGENPAIAVNEEIKFTQVGTLADGIKVKAENIIGNLPGGGGSGGGGDLLNADGVIKQEYLPEGYPYTASGGVILEETALTFDPEAGNMTYLAEEIPVPAIGDACIVNWNGTKYECVAQAYSEGGTEAGTMIGDFGGMTGGTSTGEPFIIAILYPEFAAQLGAYGMVMAIDGSTSATVSISSGSVTPIAQKFLPVGYPYFVPGGETVLEPMWAVNQLDYALPIKENYSYIVTWDGVDYECRAVGKLYNPGGEDAADVRVVVIGNAALFFSENSTDEPFVFILFPGQGTRIAFETAAMVSIKTADSYLPIDERYLPGDAGLNLVNGSAKGSLRTKNAAEDEEAASGYQIGNYAIALGEGAKAAGFYDVAIGKGAETFVGNSSYNGRFAIGLGVKGTMPFDGEMVLGKYNDTSIESFFAIGNGTSDTDRSTVLHISGNDVVIKGDIFVGGNIKLKSPSGTFFEITVSDDGALSATAT